MPSRPFTVRFHSSQRLAWLDVWPGGSCDLRVYPEGPVRLERVDLERLHAAVGYLLEAGRDTTAEGMVKAMAHLPDPEGG